MREVLRRDHLSRALAVGLFPDLLQRFFPAIPLLSEGADRARAWEASLEEVAPQALRDPFRATAARERWPLLLLNSTEVESGTRVVFSSAALGDRLPMLRDGLAELGSDLRLSTAAYLSARFPIIAPVASIPGGTHLADGGYYDNSGAATLLDVWRAAGSKAGTEFLIIRNGEGGRGVKPSIWVTEAVGPAATVIATPNARTAHAVAELSEEAELNAASVAFADLKKWPGDEEYPLGWMLSPVTADRMDARVDDFLRSEGAGLAAAAGCQ